MSSQTIDQRSEREWRPDRDTVIVESTSEVWENEHGGFARSEGWGEGVPFESPDPSEYKDADDRIVELDEDELEVLNG